jgi:hypothetical protein
MKDAPTQGRIQIENKEMEEAREERTGGTAGKNAGAATELPNQLAMDIIKIQT